MQSFQRQLQSRGGDPGTLLLDSQPSQQPAQAGEVAELAKETGRRHEVGGLGGEVIVEPSQDRLEVEPRQPPAENLEDGVLGRTLEDLLIPTLLDGVELDPS